MASNVSTVDGMGFEEVNQASSTGTISGTDIYGNTITANVVSNGTGQLYNVKAQVSDSSVLGGYRVQAGSVTTANSSSGLIVFRDPFSTGDWFMTISPRNLTNPYKYMTDGSGAVPMVSGLRRASGCWVTGGSKTEFDWIAVGTNDI